MFASPQARSSTVAPGASARPDAATSARGEPVARGVGVVVRRIAAREPVELLDRAHSARSRSGCLRTKRSDSRQCQSVRRVRKRRSVTAWCACGPPRPARTTAPSRRASRGTGGRCPRRRDGSPRRSRRAPRASCGAGAGSRRASSRTAPARLARLVEVVVALLARAALRSGVRRTIVPRDRREPPARRLRPSVRDRPSAARRRRSAGGPMKSRSAATAPGSGTASGFDGEHERRRACAATPRLRFAAKPSGRAFSIASTPGGTEPGRSRSRELVDLGSSAGSERRELARRSVRDDDCGDPHARAPRR